MKVLHQLRLLTVILVIALFAGCAGVTEANLSDSETDSPAVSAESPVQSEEAPGYFHAKDNEDMIHVRPDNNYRNRN